MALIKCPECGKEISDVSIHCVHCGFPIKKINETDDKTHENTSNDLKICPVCKTESPISEKVCPKCGYVYYPINSNTTYKKTGRMYLVEYGDNKVAVIKAIREITGLGLVDAKTLVDNAPNCIMQNITKDEFENYQHKLNSVGAKVSYIETNEKEVNNQSINKTENNEIFDLIKCPACGEKVSKFAYNCPHCGQPLSKNTQSNGMSFGGVVGAIIVAILIMMFL